MRRREYARIDDSFASNIKHRLRVVGPTSLREAIWKEEAVSSRPLRVLDVESLAGGRKVFCGVPRAGRGSGIERWPNDMRQNARLKIYEVVLQVNVGESLPFSNDSFDVIVSRESLLRNLEGSRLLEEFHRLLNDRGTIFLFNRNASNVTHIPADYQLKAKPLPLIELLSTRAESFDRAEAGSPMQSTI